MIFDELDLPKDTGSTDKQDSARLAGIMTVFGWPEKVDLNLYICLNRKLEGHYVRHPLEQKYDMSRDQAVCLVAGLYRQGYRYLVSLKYLDGKDILSPSVQGHFRRCRGGKAYWYQDLWLRFDIYWSAYVAPKDEINQLLCMLVIAGPKWVKLFKKHHSSWRENLNEYWCGWRGEPGLAATMIRFLEGYGT